MKNNFYTPTENEKEQDFEWLDDVLAWIPLPEPYVERKTNE